MAEFTVNSKQDSISEALSFIGERLKEYKLNSREESRANLMAEESLTHLIENGNLKDGGCFYASVRKFFDRVTITLKVPGEKFDFLEAVNPEITLNEEEEFSSEAQDAIRNILLNSFEDRLRYSHRQGFNTIAVIAAYSNRSALWWTFTALISALIIGALLKSFAPESFYSSVNSVLLVRIKGIYMNIVKAIVTPLIFFAILNCMTQFKSFAEIGRVGSKIVTAFLIKMFIASCIGTGIFFLLQPCDGIHLTASDPAVSSVQNSDIIADIVPSNFLRPFLEMNMFQVLFLSFLCGAGLLTMGESGKPLREFFDSCCQLFKAITKIIMRFLPLAGFCSILSAILETDTKILLSFFGFIASIVVGMLCLLSMSCIQLLIFGRLNPIHALKKFVPAALIAMASSTTASIPSNMQACSEMGVPKKIHSFSIPLGATISLDAAAMYTALSSLMLAKIYGVNVPSESILPLIISVTILTVSAPGVTGASLVCISIAIAQLGVPAEALGIIMGIDALQNFMHPPVNSFSAVASTLTVSSREKILDTEKFYGIKE